jgi:hypothetical protein
MSNKDESVTFKLVGGLGNQLFIWATSYAFERKTNKSVTLDASECTMWGEHLKNFNIVVDVPGPHKPDGILPTRFTAKSNLIINLLRALRTQFRKIRIGNTFWENPHLGYDPDVFKVDSGKVMRGYFQSHRYFQDYEHEIRDLLTQSALLSKNYHELKRRLPAKYTVIHLRLGKDYKDSSSYFKLIEDTYINESLEIVDSKSPGRCKVVVTDNVELARVLIPKADFYVGSDELSNPVDLLVLMSKSDSFIGSNSSLSWWGAFLMQDSQSVRIFPKPWFQDAKLDSRFTLPEKWIRVSN